jgi:hypothetical protein
MKQSYEQELEETVRILLITYFERGGKSELTIEQLIPVVSKYIEILDVASSKAMVKTLNKMTGKKYRVGERVQEEDLNVWRKVEKEGRLAISKKLSSLMSFDILPVYGTEEFPDSFDEEFPENH